MRQVHQIHDAEHQRQSRREQKQQQAELQSVQALFDEKRHDALNMQLPYKPSGVMRHEENGGSARRRR